MSFKKNIFKRSKTADSIAFTFSSTLENIDKVCKQATTYLRAETQGIEPHLFSINLILREGLTNAVQHGNLGDPEKRISVRLSTGDDKSIHLVIEDQGDGFDWQKLKRSPQLENRDHGRGIMIIESYSSHYSYNDKGNILYLEKEILF